VETVHRAGEGFEWVGLVNHTGRMGETLHAPAPVRDVRITLRPGRPVRTVRALKAAVALPLTDAGDGRVECVLPELGGYEVVVFEP
jgi:hypothetical protein